MSEWFVTPMKEKGEGGKPSINMEGTMLLRRSQKKKERQLAKRPASFEKGVLSPGGGKTFRDLLKRGRRSVLKERTSAHRMTRRKRILG